LSGITLISFNAINFLFCALTLLTFVRIIYKHYDFPRQEDLKTFILLGFSLALDTILYFIGVSFTNSFSAGIWGNMMPGTSFLIGVYFGFETYSLRKLLGVTIIALGITWMMYCEKTTETKENTTFFVLGQICLFAELFTYPIYLHLSKVLLKEYRPLSVTAWSFVFSSCWMIFYLVTQNMLNEDPLLKGLILNKFTLIGIVTLSILGNIVPYFFSQISNQYVDATIIITFIVFQPIFTLFTSLIVILVTTEPHYGLKGFDLSNLSLFTSFIGLVFIVSKSKEFENSKTKSSTLMNVKNISLWDVKSNEIKIKEEKIYLHV